VRNVVKNVMFGALGRLGCSAVNGFSGTDGFALTFDDGPHPEFTPRLLDILARHSARATFFVLGRQAERYPCVIDRMFRDGHAICNHTYDHPSCLALSVSEIETQIRRTDTVLQARGQKLFRPPYGGWDLRVLLATRRAGHRLVGWSAESDDHTAISAEAITRKLRELPLRGRVVLFHDRLERYREIRALDRSATIAAVDTLLSQRNGCAMTVPELMATAEPIRETRLFPYSRKELAANIRLIEGLRTADV
jgi:peptidoglycan/xylan/chitin deacetylase (PgdA/CDA1 family)